MAERVPDHVRRAGAGRGRRAGERRTVRSPGSRSRSRTTSRSPGRSRRWAPGRIRAPAAADAEAVRRLRAAGAIPVGITNVPELMIFPWTATAANGITRNPWHLDAHAGRLLGRFGQRGRCRHGGGGDRLGRRRIDPDPGRVLRSGRDEADPWPRLDAAGRFGLARVVGVRGAGADRGRQRAAARRDARRRCPATNTPRPRSRAATSRLRRRRRAGCESRSPARFPRG